MSQTTSTVLVFLKYPAAGNVKIRLAAAIGHQCAAEHYREWITLVLRQLQPLRESALIVACFDGAARTAFSQWDDLVDDWWQQPIGDLGQRLDGAFQAWQRAGTPVVAVGTDCLDLDATLVQSAFGILADQDVVFGPAADGGYYLVGTARYIPQFFEGVPWSTSETLAVHRARCRQNGWSSGLLPVRRDIDTGDDLLDYQQRERSGTLQP